MRAPTWLSRGAAVAVIAAGAVGAALGGAQAASAHDSLIATSPASGDTVTSLTDVALTFSANLLGGNGNIVIVTGPDGRHYETDCTSLAGPTLTTPVALGAAGTYEVTWRAVSSDGHPVSSDYTFTYSPAAGTTAAEGTTTSVCANAAGSGDAPAPAATDAASAPASGGSGLTLGLVLGGIAVVLVGVVVVIVLRTRSDEDEEPKPGSEQEPKPGE